MAKHRDDDDDPDYEAFDAVVEDDDKWDGEETFSWEEWLELYYDDFFEDAEYEEADGGIDYSGE